MSHITRSWTIQDSRLPDPVKVVAPVSDKQYDLPFVVEIAFGDMAFLMTIEEAHELSHALRSAAIFAEDVRGEAPEPEPVAPVDHSQFHHWQTMPVMSHPAPAYSICRN